MRVRSSNEGPTAPDKPPRRLKDKNLSRACGVSDRTTRDRVPPQAGQSRIRRIGQAPHGTIARGAAPCPLTAAFVLVTDLSSQPNELVRVAHCRLLGTPSTRS